MSIYYPSNYELGNGYYYRRVVCDQCKKAFYVRQLNEWAYIRNRKGKDHAKTYFCSYKCLRADERKNPYRQRHVDADEFESAL